VQNSGSPYEIAAMAWNEAVKRCIGKGPEPNNVDDNNNIKESI
jgi:hypothetical protein